MENSRLKKQDIIERLSYIKTVTNHKQYYGKEVSSYFIIWGSIWLVGFFISNLQVPLLTHLTWLVLGIAGWLLSIVIFLKQKNSEPMPKFLTNQLKLVGIGFVSIIYIFAFLVISEMLPLSLSHLFLYNLLLIAILYLLLGIVLTKKLFFMGLWLIGLGTATYAFLIDHLFIIFSLLGGGSLLLTGLLLRRSGINYEQS